MRQVWGICLGSREQTSAGCGPMITHSRRHGGGWCPFTLRWNQCCIFDRLEKKLWPEPVCLQNSCHLCTRVKQLHTRQRQAMESRVLLTWHQVRMHKLPFFCDQTKTFRSPRTSLLAAPSLSPIELQNLVCTHPAKIIWAPAQCTLGWHCRNPQLALPALWDLPVYTAFTNRRKKWSLPLCATSPSCRHQSLL